MTGMDQERQRPGALIPVGDTERLLSRVEFQGLARVPAEVEWFANIDNPRTRRAYQTDVSEFARFVGVQQAEEFRQVTRAHVIAWRDDLKRRQLSPATMRRKLSALSSLFEYLCDHNAVPHNPVKGVARPREAINEGKTPALSAGQARRLLEAPPAETLKGKRDRAILAALLYHGLRREELCGLTVGAIQQRRGILHFRVHGKGSKTRYVPIHPRAIGLIEEYLEAAGHREDRDGALFRPVKNNATGDLAKALSADAVYLNVVLHHARGARVYFAGLCPHALRATAATTALENGSDIAKVQEWLGHANVSTTRLYDKRQSRPEESPTYKVEY